MTCMKYINKQRLGYDVNIRSGGQSFRQYFPFSKFENIIHLALIAATIYRDQICFQEGIPVVDKQVHRLSTNKTGFYYVEKQGDRYYFRGGKPLPDNDPRNSISMVEELDIERFGAPVKRLVLSR